MEITSVKVRKFDKEGSPIKGYATVTIDDCFVVKNIKIVQGEEKMQIQMPQQKLPNGHFKDCAHPINQETRNMFVDKILEEYNNPTNN